MMDENVIFRNSNNVGSYLTGRILAKFQEEVRDFFKNKKEEVKEGATLANIRKAEHEARRITFNYYKSHVETSVEIVSVQDRRKACIWFLIDGLTVERKYGVSYPKSCFEIAEGLELTDALKQAEFLEEHFTANALKHIYGLPLLPASEHEKDSSQDLEELRQKVEDAVGDGIELNGKTHTLETLAHHVTGGTAAFEELNEEELKSILGSLKEGAFTESAENKEEKLHEQG